MDSTLDVLAIVAGAALVLTTVLSAARTVVLPHGRPVRLTGAIFRATRRVVDWTSRLARTPEGRHAVFSSYAPLSLLLLPLTWLGSSLVGFTLVFWGLDTRPLREAFKLAGSSLLTLGFFDVDDLPRLVVAFLAAALAISVLGILLVTYLPTMYQAYSTRETAITSLESFAGEPPRAAEMLTRMHGIGAWSSLSEIWTEWREWFAEARETHTALPAVVLFQSSSHERSWVGTVGVLLDAAAVHEAISQEGDADAQLCIRAGYLALREIAGFYRIPFDPDPEPDDPISVTRDEFEAVVSELAAAGIPMTRTGRDAWEAYAGWRVNYDAVLVGLADLTGTEDVSLERRSVG